MAVEEQSVPLLRAALKRCHMCPGEHALHEAARRANLPAIRMLLQEKADPNARCMRLERGCEFPLQLIVSGSAFLGTSDRCQAAELLLNARALPNVRRRDAEANMPLHDAVRRRDVQVVQHLLRHSADPNAMNGFGATPLCFAAALFSGVGDFMDSGAPLEIAEALLLAGASPLTADIQALPLDSGVFDPDLRELIARWSGWWRCRTLAWIRSRGRDHPLCELLPELLVQVAKFL